MDLYTIFFFVHDGHYCRTLDPIDKYSNAVLFLEMVKLIKDKMYIDSFMIVTYQGFQYFSSLPVLHYLQVVLFIRMIIILIQHSLKSGGTKDHFRQVKVPGTASY